jgi:hypothetical protein
MTLSNLLEWEVRICPSKLINMPIDLFSAYIMIVNQFAILWRAVDHDILCA